MRLARFSFKDTAYTGFIEGEGDNEVIRADNSGDVLGCAQAYAEVTVKGDGESFPLKDVKLLSPVLPSKVVAVGLNYRAHAAEFDKAIPEDPMIFLKPSTSVIGPGDEIIYPFHMSRRVDFEGELAVVIGKKARAVSIDDAKDYILGYTCLNDVTARDLQAKDTQYTRAKGFDTFCPIGPWIETDLDPSDVLIETIFKGEKRQETRTSDMIFSVFELVSFISNVMTLMPGDVIATGTPSGVGKMKPGDEVEIRIEGIGSLVNRVAASV